MAELDQSKENKKLEADIAALDEPVRNHLKEILQTPSLTREQEVEIFKRIDEADLALRERQAVTQSIAEALASRAPSG